MSNGNVNYCNEFICPLMTCMCLGTTCPKWRELIAPYGGKPSFGFCELYLYVEKEAENEAG